MVKGVFFDSPDPFLLTKSASLYAPLDARLGQSIDLKRRLGELVEAEFSLSVALHRWKEVNSRLVEIAKSEAIDIDPDIQPPPLGYGAQASVLDHKILIQEAEWLVSAVLDAFYVLCERIVAMTSALHRESDNDVWPDIGRPTQGSNKKGSLVEQNLVCMFGADRRVRNGDKGVLALKRIIEVRGKRTHDCHFNAHVRLPAGTVAYLDVIPHGAIPPSIAFDESEMNGWLQAGRAFLAWWVSTTYAQLKQDAEPAGY